MSINVVDTYLALKVKHITKYAKILLKSVYQAKSDNTEMLGKCIDKYLKYFVLDNKAISDFESKTEEFCLKNNINNEKEKKVVAVLFDTIPRLDIEILDSESTKNIMILSVLITAAIMLEEYTTSLAGSNFNYKEAIDKIKLDNSLSLQRQLLTTIKLVNPELKELTNENIRAFNKFLNLQKKVIFHLDFFQVFDLKKTPSIFFEVELKYDSKGLENFASERITELINLTNVASEYALITIEKLSVVIFRELFDQKTYNKFFVRLPNNFFDKRSNVKKLLSITKLSEIRNKIGFKINGVQLEKYYDDIVNLKENNFSIAIDDSSYLNYNVGKIKNVANYIFVASELSEAENKILKLGEENSVCLLLKEVKHSEIFLDL